MVLSLLGGFFLDLACIAGVEMCIKDEMGVRTLTYVRAVYQDR